MDSGSQNEFGITNCCSFMDVSAKSVAGGIVGHSRYAWMDSCFSMGTISSKEEGYSGTIRSSRW